MGRAGVSFGSQFRGLQPVMWVGGAMVVGVAELHSLQKGTGCYSAVFLIVPFLFSVEPLADGRCCSDLGKSSLLG